MLSKGITTHSQRIWPLTACSRALGKTSGELANENVIEIGKFDELLSQLVLCLKESNHSKELGHGVLYIQLQKKLPENLLCQYHKWIHEHSKYESVLALKEFVKLELNFRTIADETLNGLAKEEVEHPRAFFYRNFFNFPLNYRQSERGGLDPLPTLTLSDDSESPK